ncbi:MAG: hypothetical protein H7144_00115 [Burkholderiales bacterium]|nr:hypothetical protein [Phycisphaerae bacterium]
MTPRKVHLITALLAIAFAASGVLGGDYVRAIDDAGYRCLQSSITTYTHASDVRVTLIAAVHVGDGAYYDHIRRQIATADSVIHEGIVRSQRTPIARFDWAESLGLARQTSVIRCAGARYIRGDLTEAEFDRIRAPFAPGDTPASRAALADSIVACVTNPNARQYVVGAFAIEQRNRAAIAALRARLARGDRDIILLYGAAHAQDLSDRLTRELGFAEQAKSWLRVFDY